MNEPESIAIRWEGDHLALLDQRLLPRREEWLTLHDAEGTAEAIRHMVVRGAPAIGITAAYGLVLAAKGLGGDADPRSLAPALTALRESRPTAVNLFWALARMEQAMAGHAGTALADALEREARAIHTDDLTRNRQLGAHGADLLADCRRLYTHCNTGALATGGHGTALGIIRTAHERGTLERVHAGETRPWLQGTRLTVWELMRSHIPVTLVTDSCAGELMRRGEVDAVVVGADRVTANGDVANKIGTYGLAVLARHHGLPFVVAAPCSTLDAATATGADIHIEQRDAAEISGFRGEPLAPEGCEVFNPVFDITPASLVSAIVTERGVIHSPGPGDIAAHLEHDHD